MNFMNEVGYVLYIATCFIFALQHCSGGKLKFENRTRNKVLCTKSLCLESCSNRGNIRLEYGANKFEGQVEVCENRSASNTTLIWKTVCNAGWDMNEAMVVCRQLGFSGNLTRMFGLSLICTL